MIELQLQGLVGPTHNYAGLGLGNRASEAHGGEVSNPRAAALQSLQLMRWLVEHEVPLAVMPPQSRPRLDVLARLGFEGDTQTQLLAANEAAPSLLRGVWSSSFMWTANAATVTPSMDSAEGQLHLTPANLISSLHRMIEAREAQHFLQQIFPFAAVHAPLNVTTRLADEGAANHMRLCTESTGALHLFIYGAAPPDSAFPAQTMPRQQRAACEAVAENHQLPVTNCLYAQQHPDAIDAGVFHNDVIALSHRNLLLCHEKAYLDQGDILSQWREQAPWLHIRVVSESELPLEDAVKTYFFNAQLIDMPSGGIGILFPKECAENSNAARLAESLHGLPMVDHIGFWDLRESMKNGGGPACLRLRVPLTPDQLAQIHAGVRLNLRKIQQLERFIESRYRDRVCAEDLLDAEFAQEAIQAQQELLKLLNVKPFQPIKAFA